jgi:NTP pyrophosphatase (non-canonical NTP hydrolase)
MEKLNEIAQKAYECAVRRGKIDPDNDSNNNLHRDLLEEVAEVFECTGEKSPHIKEYLDVEEELADVIIVALSTLHHFKCDIDSLIEAKMNYNKNRIVEAFVLIFALPCVYKDFMNLWKEK